MEVLSKIVSIILVIILVSLLPLQYLMGHQLSLFNKYVGEEAAQLVNDIREKKYLDVTMYENFLKDISVTGLLYDIEIEHAVPKKDSDSASLDNLPGVLVVSSELSSLPLTTETVTIPGNDKEDNSEKTVDMEPQLCSVSRMDIGVTVENSIVSFSTHTHTEDCYSGHRHTSSCYGYVGNRNGPLNVVINYGGGGFPNMVRISCANCSKTLIQIAYFGSEIHFQGSYYYYNIDNVAGGANRFDTGYTNTTYYSGSTEYYKMRNAFYNICNLLTAYGLNYNNNWANGLYIPYASWGTLWYPTYSSYWTSVQQFQGCPYCGAATLITTCGQTQDDTPDCNTVVTSITATNPTQTVNKGDSIVTTATATYLDGHTGTVNCSSNFNPNLMGTQVVTLTYSGLVGNAKTTGTKTCTVTVIVREDSIPSYLTVTPSASSVYNGTEPDYLVVVTYENGTKKTITNGYSKTGWSSGWGTKTVTFSYTENGKTVTYNVGITVLPNIISVSVDPVSQEVERYKEPFFNVTAQYEDGTKRSVNDYTVSGYDNTIMGTRNVTIQYTENSVTKSCIAEVTVTPMKRICAECGNGYYLDENDYDQGCPVCRATVSYIQVSPSYTSVLRGGALDITVTATYLDGHTEAVTGWSSNLDSAKTGSQLVMVTYMGKYAYIAVTVVDEKVCDICGNTYSLDEDGTDQGCPLCKEEVISISATPETQTVDEGEEISLTVTATYRDGHTEEVTGWRTSYNANATGEQKVTVYYKDKTCSITVTVVSEEEVQCTICATYYNYKENPLGCPVCAATLIGIEASLINGGTATVYGKPLELAVILTYRDGDKVLIYTGYQDDYDPYVLGEQTVTVSDTDKYSNTVSCVITVNVVEATELEFCENGHLYNPSDGECPYCAAINSAEISLYSDCHYSDEILNTLYTDGIYYVLAGDLITVKVTINTNGTIYSMGLFRKNEGMTPITYGGEVA